MGRGANLIMTNRFFKSLTIGLRRRWFAGLTKAFSVAGLIWLVTEITTKALPSVDKFITENGVNYLYVVIGICILAFFYHIYETRSVSFVVPTTGIRISIRYGDLLKEDTDWLIGVGELFDSELGHVVSPRSLHGKVIETIWNSDCGKFRKDIDSALDGIPFEFVERPHEPKRKYVIGTTAVLPRAGRKIFLVAMARTDVKSSKASSSVPLLWDGMRGALRTVHNYGNGNALSLPLIGNGQSSVNIEPQHLLRLIVLALVDFGRSTKLPSDINIILPEDCFTKLDIREIQRDWSHK